MTVLFLTMPVKRDLMKMDFNYAEWINCDCQAMTGSRCYYYCIYMLKFPEGGKARCGTA